MIGERWREEAGRELEYWQIREAQLIARGHHPRRPADRTDALVPARSRQDDPRPCRWQAGRSERACTTALAIVRREFKLNADDLFVQERLNLVGWDVDSATSSQRVFGVAAELRRDVQVLDDRLGASYPATSAGGGIAQRARLLTMSGRIV